MSLAGILRILGLVAVAMAGAMVPAAVLAVPEGLIGPWLGAIGVSLVLGVTLWRSTPRDVQVDHRTGLIVVALTWLEVVAIGSLPFVFTRVVPNVVAAFFESVSGFTTTGATVFPAIEALPHSILLWRSVTHWIGGMGIIVLGVAILPFLGVGGAQLFRAEAPGISTDRLTPRIASTARLLWGVYAGLTGLLAVIYLVLGMSVFDAVNHAMSTLATGGFSTRTASMAYYRPAIQWVTVLFMFLAGVNFALHFRMLTGRVTVWFRDIEWRVFAGLVGVAIVVCFGVLLVGSTSGVGKALRDAAFNVVAVATTTGFATDDFAVWPVLGQAVLLGLMVVGAMGGSTGGGLKVVRVIVLAKHARTAFRLVLHPRAVAPIRLGGKRIREDILLNVVSFFILFIATHAIGTILLAAMGYDIVTAGSAAIAAMSSIGPGLGAVGPASHYGDMSGWAQFTLTALMLLGRLEFYTLLVIFLPETWKMALRPAPHSDLTASAKKTDRLKRTSMFQ